MSNPEHLRRHALECLRLQADCMQLAGDARNPYLQSHFLRMAGVWSALTVSEAETNRRRAFSEVETQTT
jgi:hypothetical protein